MDPIASADLDQLLLSLRNLLGTTLVVVTHKLASIFTIADRVLVLDAATQTVVSIGDPETLRDRSEIPWVRKGDFRVASKKLSQGFGSLSELAERIDVDEVHDNLLTLAGNLRVTGQELRGFLDDPCLAETLYDFFEAATGASEVFKGKEGGLAAALSRIPEAIDRLDRLSARTEAILEDQRIDQILEGMSQAADSAPGTMQNVEATTAELRRLARELGRLAMLLNEDLQVITENLSRVTGGSSDRPPRKLVG